MIRQVTFGFLISMMSSCFTFYICCFSISIHSWDTTTSAFRKQMNAIWKFYVRFRFWAFYRHLHIILQRRNKFCLNWTITERVIMLVDFSRCRPYRRKYSFAFWFHDISPSGRQRTICVLNFDQISQSTAKLLLLLVVEDKRPPCLNFTPGFNKLFTVIGILWFCTGLPNFMQIRWSPTELWRHIDCVTFRNIQSYQHNKFRPDISIHGRDITTSGFWKQTAAILKF